MVMNLSNIFFQNLVDFNFSVGPCLIDHPAADLSWVGDGFCDDAANIANCNYDGGDCCGLEIDNSYCQICECFTEETNEECSIPSLVGDGICDDLANFPVCNYDNGDCCGEDLSYWWVSSTPFGFPFHLRL